MAKLWPWEARTPKWHLAYFWDMDFKLVLPSIYINFDIQTKFEDIQTQIGHYILKKLQKLTKVAISQKPILPKCHSPKSLLLLHFWILGSNFFWRPKSKIGHD